MLRWRGLINRLAPSSLSISDFHALGIPQSFATRGGQETALDGRVMLYTAQSPAFLKRIYNPTAVTAALPLVANPTGISINNAFGRLWLANWRRFALA